MKKLKSREINLLQAVQLLSGPEDLSPDVILEFTCLNAIPFFLRSECSESVRREQDILVYSWGSLDFLFPLKVCSHYSSLRNRVKLKWLNLWIYARLHSRISQIFSLITFVWHIDLFISTWDSDTELSFTFLSHSCRYAVIEAFDPTLQTIVAVLMLAVYQAHMAHSF